MLTRKKCSQEGCNGRVEASKTGIIKQFYFVDEEGFINYDEMYSQIVPMPQDATARCNKCKTPYKIVQKGTKVGETLTSRR